MSNAVTAELSAQPVADERSATTSIGEAGLLFASRVALWVGIQLLVFAIIVPTGLAALDNGLNVAAGWWMIYGMIVDLGTLTVLLWLLRPRAIAYRRLLGPPAEIWQIALGAAAILVASAPAVFFSAELTSAMFDSSTPPMFAIVDVPALIAVPAAVIGPLLTELAEPVAYLGVILPALERRFGRLWLAAPVVVVVWATEHAFFPLLVTGGEMDFAFAAYRIVSVLPFLATWTGLYYAFGRRLLPLMAARYVFNGGSALALALGWV